MNSKDRRKQDSLLSLPELTNPHLRLVGFAGLAGSGKDTCANLISHYKYDKLAFAKRLKDMAAMLYGIDRLILEGGTVENRKLRDAPLPMFNNKSVSSRKLLQMLGHRVRQVHPDTWVLAVFNEMSDRFIQAEIEGYELPYPNFAVSDVRYINELLTIKAAGGKVYEVVRGPKPEWCQEVHDTLDIRNPAVRDTEWFQSKYQKQPIHISEWMGQTAYFQDHLDGVIDNTTNDVTSHSMDYVKEQLAYIHDDALVVALSAVMESVLWQAKSATIGQ